MSTDLRPDARTEHDRRQIRRARAVLAIGAWNVWVWATRLVNALRDGGTNAASDVVHGLLFSFSLALAVVLVVIGWRMLRESRS